MNSAPFMPQDLAELDALLSRADRVVPMVDVWRGDTSPGVVGLRHDVDDNAGSLETALAMARWEHERGFRSTFYLLHDSHYWPNRDAAREIVQLGHEVGLHVNCIAEAIRQSRDPHEILTEALRELRCAAPVSGVVAHGDGLCHQHNFVNDELFVESARPSYGEPDRVVAGVKLEPLPMGLYGIRYQANWLSRGVYLSDSGGRWSLPFEETAEGFPFAGQLHVLQHPDHWGRAFLPVAVAA